MTGGTMPKESITKLKDSFDDILDLVTDVPEGDINSDWWTEFLKLSLEERNRLLEQVSNIVLKELAKWILETNHKPYVM